MTKMCWKRWKSEVHPGALPTVTTLFSSVSGVGPESYVALRTLPRIHRQERPSVYNQRSVPTLTTNNKRQVTKNVLFREMKSPLVYVVNGQTFLHVQVRQHKIKFRDSLHQGTGERVTGRPVPEDHPSSARRLP